MTIEKLKKQLKPFNAVIQVCPRCNKIDVYLGHEKECDPEFEANRQENLEYYK